MTRTQKNNLHSIPTDCPHREKRGWMGDAQVSSAQASLNFDMDLFYQNFVASFADMQSLGCTNPNHAERRNLLVRPPTYECCNMRSPSFGCNADGTNFSDVTGSLPDVVGR